MATTTTNDTPLHIRDACGLAPWLPGIRQTATWLRLLLPEKKSSWYNTLRVAEPGLWTTQSLC